jgi:hypothetical protein
VASTEITPPGYFYFLHEWLGHYGAHSEWIAPAAFGAGRGAASGGGLLADVARQREASHGAVRGSARGVLSFVLEFAQRAQGYEFVALAVTVAVAAAVQAERRHSTRWFAVALITAIIALCVHHTAVLVLAPLCVWTATRPAFTLRTMFVGMCTAVGIALIPLLIRQHNTFPTRSGVGASGNVTNVLKMIIDVPFTGRVQASGR